MAKKSRANKRKKKKKSSPLLIFVLVIVVLAAVSLSVSYFLLQDDSHQLSSIFENSDTTEETTELTDPPIIKDPVEKDEPKTLLEGTWVSNYDGNIMTINRLGFTLESPSVSTSSKLSGKISIEKNIITFSYTSGSEACGSTEGHYQFQLEGAEEVFFKLIKDDCSSRKERNTMGWFKL